MVLPDAADIPTPKCVICQGFFLHKSTGLFWPESCGIAFLNWTLFPEKSWLGWEGIQNILYNRRRIS